MHFISGLQAWLAAALVPIENCRCTDDPGVSVTSASDAAAAASAGKKAGRTSPTRRIHPKAARPLSTTPR
jgi:hypothetical protein